MNTLIGLIAMGFGAALLAGVRRACYFLVPEVWFWHRLFGIRVTPMYRRTVGVLLICVGLVSLFLDSIIGAFL